MARDHEPAVETFEVGQPHTKLIAGTVPGGVIHGELGAVLLERLADADRGTPADRVMPGWRTVIITTDMVPRMTINK